MLHAKSLNADKAWEVYEYLMDFYIQGKERAESKGDGAQRERRGSHSGEWRRASPDYNT